MPLACVKKLRRAVAVGEGPVKEFREEEENLNDDDNDVVEEEEEELIELRV